MAKEMGPKEREMRERREYLFELKERARKFASQQEKKKAKENKK